MRPAARAAWRIAAVRLRVASSRLSRSLLFLRGRPPLGGNRLAGEVDDGVGAVDAVRPRAGMPSGVQWTNDTCGCAAAAGDGLPRQDGDVVSVAASARVRRGAEESGPAGDDDAHEDQG